MPEAVADGGRLAFAWAGAAALTSVEAGGTKSVSPHFGQPTGDPALDRATPSNWPHSRQRNLIDGPDM